LDTKARRTQDLVPGCRLIYKAGSLRRAGIRFRRPSEHHRCAARLFLVPGPRNLLLTSFACPVRL